VVSFFTGTQQQVGIVTIVEKDSTETLQSQYRTEELANVSMNEIKTEKDVTLRPHKSKMKLHCLNISEQFFEQFPRQHFLAVESPSSAIHSSFRHASLLHHPPRPTDSV
jgi:hypothetical protein